MMTYIVLGRLTALAKTRPAEALKARDQVFAEFQKKGLKISYFMTLGPYDVVTLVESPSEELLVKFLTAAGAQGYVDSTTMRAFPANEADKLRTG